MSRESQTDKNKLRGLAIPSPATTTMQPPAKGSSPQDTNVEPLRTFRRVNRKFIGITLAVGVGVGVGAKLLHDYQVRRNADQLLARADAAEKEDKRGDAVKLLNQYIALRYKDQTSPSKEDELQHVELLARLGRLTDPGDDREKQPDLFRAYRTFEEVLRRDPARRDIRRRTAEIAMFFRRYRDARDHFQLLKPESVEDPQESSALFKLLAQCQLAVGESTESQLSYLEALASVKTDAEPYLALAAIWTELPEKAVDVGRDESLRNARFNFVRAALPGTVQQHERGPAQCAGELLNLMSLNVRPTALAELRRAQFLMRTPIQNERLPQPSQEVANGSAQEIMSKADRDHDQLLTADELLHPAVPTLADQDHDGKLTANELANRLMEGDRKGLLLEAERSILTAWNSLDDASSASPGARPADVILTAIEVYSALADASRLGDDQLVFGAQVDAPEVRNRKSFLTAAAEFADRGNLIKPPDPQLLIASAELALRQLDEVSSTDERIEKLTLVDDMLKRGAELSKEAGADSAARPSRDAVALTTKLLWLRADVLYTIAALERGPNVQKLQQDAAKVAKDLKDLKPPQYLIDTLAARGLMAEKKWSEARQLLESLRNSLTVGTELWRRTTLQLAECQSRLGNPDAVLDLFRTTAQVDPTYPSILQWRLGEAAALVDMDRIDEASARYSQLAKQGLSGTLQRLVELQLYWQSLQPADRREWTTLDGCFPSLPKSLPNAEDVPLPHSPRMAVLWAEYAYLRSATASQLFEQTPSEDLRSQADTLMKFADLVLAAAETKFATDPQIPAARAALAIRRTDLDDATRLRNMRQILDKAVERLKDCAELRMAAINSTLIMPPELATQVLEDAASGIDQFSTDDQVRIQAGLARAYASKNDLGRALACWERAIELRPDDLTQHVAVLELLLISAVAREGEFAIDDARWQKHFGEVSKLEGGDGQGPFALVFSARRTIAESIGKPGSKPDRAALAAKLEPARRALESAARRRAYWSVIPRELGRIDQLLGSRDLAVQQFIKAIEAGDRSEPVIGTVLEYYYEQSLTADGSNKHAALEKAARLVELVDQKNPSLLSGDVGRLASRLMLGRMEVARAIGIADRIKALTPEDKYLKAVSHLASVKAPERNSNDNPLAPLRIEDFEQDSQKQLNDAQRLLTEAVSEAPGLAKGWIALVTLQVQLRDVQRAVEILREAGEKLPPEPAYVRPLTAASCHEILFHSGLLPPEERQQHRDQADQLYHAALDADPTNPQLQYVVASFDNKMGRPDKAMEGFDRLMSESSASVPTRLRASIAKAVTLASSGRRADFDAALALLASLEAPKKDWQVQIARARAQILGRSSLSADQRQLAESLETLKSLDRLSDAEHLLLARTYSSLGNWKKAEPAFLGVLTARPKDAVAFSDYVEALIRSGQLDRAAEQLKLLDAMVPDFFGVTGLQARLMNARGNPDEAAALLNHAFADLKVTASETSLSLLVHRLERTKAAEIIETYLKSEANGIDPAVARIAGDSLAAGNVEAAVQVLGPAFYKKAVNGALYDISYRLLLRLMDEFQRPAAAEIACRKYIEVTGKSQEKLTLAGLVAKQGRIDEALELCDQAKDVALPQAVASIAVRALSSGQPTAKQLERGDQILAEAVRKKPESLYLASELANLRNLQGRYDEAVALYHVILGKQPNSVLALNNLALLLALQKKDLDEALKMIDLAIELTGKDPELLDTRASILLSLNRPEQAVAVMELVVAEKPTASAHWHLARAQLAAGNHEAAQQSFAQARQAGLTDEAVHPLERPALREFNGQIQPRSEARR